MFRAGGCLAFLLCFALLPCTQAEDKKDAKKDKKEAFKLSAEEQGVIDLTNAERKKADKSLEPLKMNPKLMEAARKHAANMAAQEKLEHELDCKTPADRAEAAGYEWSAIGENIAQGQETPKKVVAGWMDSPPHRGNILNSEYTEIGVAVAKSKSGELYWVQVFGKQ
jgi:uncharacterized protein YkwD